VSTGFHLKEYLTFELADIFRRSGFSRVRAGVGIRGFYVFLPILPVRWIEMLMLLLSPRLQRLIAVVFPFRSLLGINLIAEK
jgi:hypothetical protein